MNVVRFVIGFVMTVGGAILFIDNGNSFPSVPTILFLLVTVVGFVLTITSGFEARLILGIILAAGSLLLLFLYSREPEIEFLLVPAVLGVFLFVSGLLRLFDERGAGSGLLTSIRALFFRRGG